VPFQHARIAAGQVPNPDRVVVRPETTVRPSGLTATEVTQSLCHSSTRDSPLARSQPGPRCRATPRPPFARQESTATE